MTRFRELIDTIQCANTLDLLHTMPNNSVHCVVTSPPYYGLRDYGTDGQIGLEDTPDQYVARLVELFAEVRRVLREDGTCWLNLGDSFGEKQLLGIPWRVALALQADGWWLRSDIIWAKPNPMPESVKDRPTKSHEYVFLLTKSGDSLFWTHRKKDGTRVRPEPDYRWIHKDTKEKIATMPPQWDTSKAVKKLWRRVNLWRGRDYWYDADAIKEPSKPSTLDRDKYKRTGYKKENRVGPINHLDPNSGEYRDCSSGRNKRTVWTVTTESKPFKHFAMFPQALIEPMILAGCPLTVCSECGAGHVRVTEVIGKRQVQNGPGTAKKREIAAGRHGSTSALVTGFQNVTQTVGFSPTCDCNAPTSHGIVFDPFMGSGTTALVAQRLKRHFIGCDINAEYVELARNRVKYRGDDKRMIKEQKEKAIKQDW